MAAISARSISERLASILTFKNASIARKLQLFACSVLFWLVVTAAISFVCIFDIQNKSSRMIDIIWPQREAVSVLINGLRDARQINQEMSWNQDKELIRISYEKAKQKLDECGANLNALISGGMIKDTSQSDSHFNRIFLVSGTNDPAKKKALQNIITMVEQLASLLDAMEKDREESDRATVQFQEKLFAYNPLTTTITNALNKYIGDIDQEWQSFTITNKRNITNALFIITITFAVCAVTALLLGFLIARDISRPIKAILKQIKAFSSGERGAVQKIEVTSRDEIGDLYFEFNKLMDTVAVMTSFKKVIEEDETVDDIYLRLGNIFNKDIMLQDCIMYEVAENKNTMKAVYPENDEGQAIRCKMDILLNADLCRAKRTGHAVSSIEYGDICKYFAGDAQAVHSCIPVTIGGKIGGVVQFVDKRSDSNHLQELKNKISLAQQYIIESQPVFEAKRLTRALRESSYKDTMTGLYNRKFLEETEENLIAGICRRGATLGLLMCDIDFFKQTNDTYGHDVGDIVLAETATAIRKSVRASDLVVRFGGEEFLVFLMDIRPDEAMQVADKIRNKIEQTKVRARLTADVIQKTISIGVSEFPGDTKNFWESIKYSDVALYKAKETGRNRVVRFTPEMWTETKY